MDATSNSDAGQEGGEVLRHVVGVLDAQVMPGVDLESPADQVFTTFEGGFILARATGDPGALRAQLTHLRTYLALLFDVPPVPRVAGNQAFA